LFAHARRQDDEMTEALGLGMAYTPNPTTDDVITMVFAGQPEMRNRCSVPGAVQAHSPTPDRATFVVAVVADVFNYDKAFALFEGAQQ
jgi:hypothetical protein